MEIKFIFFKKQGSAFGYYYPGIILSFLVVFNIPPSFSFQIPLRKAELSVNYQKFPLKETNMGSKNLFNQGKLLNGTGKAELPPASMNLDKDLKIDSQSIEELTEGELNKIIEIPEMEDLANDFSMPKDMRLSFDKNGLEEKLSKYNSSLSSSNVLEAQEELSKKKKKYAAMQDSRLKDLRTKRNSLSASSFWERTEWGATIQQGNRGIGSGNLSFFAGYRINSISTAGIGITNPRGINESHSGVKGYYNLAFGSYFFWTSEFDYRRNVLDASKNSGGYNQSMLLTGIGTNVKILKRIYIRTSVLYLFGRDQRDISSISKNLYARIGIFFQPLNHIKPK
jgi:hypothetical protein